MSRSRRDPPRRNVYRPEPKPPRDPAEIDAAARRAITNLVAEYPETAPILEPLLEQKTA
jgi:hypothetical protein